jgi:hypothetical protein
MFKDCKTGGYNLEKSHACNQRLNTLILLIAFAYSCAIFQGKRIQEMGIQKYVGRTTESGQQDCDIVAFGLDYMVNPGY